MAFSLSIGRFPCGIAPQKWTFCVELHCKIPLGEKGRLPRRVARQTPLHSPLLCPPSVDVHGHYASRPRICGVEFWDMNLLAPNGGAEFLGWMFCCFSNKMSPLKNSPLKNSLPQKFTPRNSSPRARKVTLHFCSARFTPWRSEDKRVQHNEDYLQPRVLQVPHWKLPGVNVQRWCWPRSATCGAHCPVRPKGPHRTKNTARSKFTTRSEFSIALWFTDRTKCQNPRIFKNLQK